MAVQSPPYALQNSQHSSALFRQAVVSQFFRQGIVGATEFAVAAQSTPNMSVQVAAGRAWISGSQVAAPSGFTFTTQAGYFALNDGPVSLTIATADATNPRIDVVYVAVQDAFYSGASNQALLGVVTGTPAPSPVAPTAPANSTVLARVAVAANATSIVSGNLSDVRLSSVPTPQLYTCTSSTRPTPVWAGFEIFETDTGLVKLWTGAAWITVGPFTLPGILPGGYTDSTQTLTTSGTAEQILAGTQNNGGVSLVTGRAYGAVWEGRIGSNGAMLAQLVVRAARAATPTTASAVASGTNAYLSGNGGPFQVDVTTGLRPFQVGTGGSWHFSLSGAVAAGSGTTLTALPDIRTVHSISVTDLGPAPAGLRSI